MNGAQHLAHRMLSVLLCIGMILVSVPPARALAPASQFKEESSPEAALQNLLWALTSQDRETREEAFLRMAESPAHRSLLIRILFDHPRLRTNFYDSEDPAVLETILVWERLDAFLRAITPCAAVKQENPPMAKALVAWLVQDSFIFHDVSVLAQGDHPAALRYLLLDTLQEIKPHQKQQADEWAKENISPTDSVLIQNTTAQPSPLDISWEDLKRWDQGSFDIVRTDQEQPFTDLYFLLHSYYAWFFHQRHTSPVPPVYLQNRIQEEFPWAVRTIEKLVESGREIQAIRSAEVDVLDKDSLHALGNIQHLMQDSADNGWFYPEHWPVVWFLVNAIVSFTPLVSYWDWRCGIGRC